MTDLATEALELAAFAVGALHHHGVHCQTCDTIIDERVGRVEAAMKAALRDWADDETLEVAA